MMSATFMSDLQNNMQRVYEAQMQEATGKRIQRLSDDPIGIIQGLNARAQLYRLEQFQRNITDARRWMEASETSLREMSEIAQEAYVLAEEAATDTISPEVRATAIAPKVKVLIDQLASVCNSTTSDEYTFGGFNTSSNQPVTQDASGQWLYNNVPLSSLDGAAIDADANANTLEFQIGYGLNMPVTKTAPQALVYDRGAPPKDLLNRLQQFYDDLSSGTCTSTQVQGYITDFQDAQTHVNAVVSEMGGRTNRVDMLTDRYGKDELMYSSLKSTIEDVDISEAIMNFAMAQSVYTASLQVGARVIQPTLLDYLR